jgi:selenocysteine lyase/cysteine desulfurase
MDLLRSHVFGNPHSQNPTSQAMTDRVEAARRYVLEFFDAAPDEYEAIFTPNASGALKLLGESYPFGGQGHYALSVDNHNSVNGIREFARSRGAQVTYLPLHPDSMRLDLDAAAATLAAKLPDAAGLLAYPAQSNFTGVQHPLELIAQAQAQGWDVLLDAAAFAPTNHLDLSRWQPDFVSLSFYKMFGYPTGAGCLLARKAALAKLRRPWFAGGTIVIASVQGGGRHRLSAGAAAFEDGTVDYLSLPAVEIGLRHLDAIGMDLIHSRVACLTGWLLDELAALRHANGAPLVRIYGPTSPDRRGGTLAFNLMDPTGDPFHFRAVEALANEQAISLRTGCFCNPGAGETAHDVTPDEMTDAFQTGDIATFDEFYGFMAEHYCKMPGTVRASVGLVSNFADVYRFVEFVRTFRDRRAAEVGTVSYAAHVRDAA